MADEVAQLRQLLITLENGTKQEARKSHWDANAIITWNEEINNADNVIALYNLLDTFQGSLKLDSMEDTWNEWECTYWFRIKNAKPVCQHRNQTHFGIVLRKLQISIKLSSMSWTEQNRNDWLTNVRQNIVLRVARDFYRFCLQQVHWVFDVSIDTYERKARNCVNDLRNAAKPTNASSVCNSAKLLSGCFLITGGFTTAFGLCAAPFTGGASLAILPFGTAVMASSGISSLGATAVGRILDNDKIEIANAAKREVTKPTMMLNQLLLDVFCLFENNEEYHQINDVDHAQFNWVEFVNVNVEICTSIFSMKGAIGDGSALLTSVSTDVTQLEHFYANVNIIRPTLANAVQSRVVEAVFPVGPVTLDGVGATAAKITTVAAPILAIYHGISVVKEGLNEHAHGSTEYQMRCKYADSIERSCTDLVRKYRYAIEHFMEHFIEHV